MDVFLLFSPTWLSSYEQALSWITDYKPSLVLRLLDGTVQGLTAEQTQRLEQVKDETKKEEKELNAAMAGVQESVAGPTMLELVRRVGRLLDEEIGELESSLEGLKRAMVEILGRADQLRVSSVRKAVAILSPPQTVQFLAEAAEFQLRVRRWGSQSDSRSQSPHTGGEG